MFKKGFLLKKKKQQPQRQQRQQQQRKQKEAVQTPQPKHVHDAGDASAASVEDVAVETDAATTIPTPQVLVLGDTATHNNHLVRSVRQIAGIADGDDVHVQHLPLKTKYYSANIHLVVEGHEDGVDSTINPSADDEDDSAANAQQPLSALSSPPRQSRCDELVEAAVLVVSGHNLSSFHAVTHLWEEVHQRGDRFPKLDIQLITVLAEGGVDSVEPSCVIVE